MIGGDVADLFDTEETIFKIEVKVENEWIPMERCNPLVAALESRRKDLLREAQELYGKPVRLVKVNRQITVLETLEEETVQGG
jgi:hypothetical protein